MYAGVPTEAPVRVSRVDAGVGAAGAASPKSATRAAPSAPTKMFPGFTSRCSTPREWAKATARAACATSRAASTGGTPSSRHSSRNDGPSTRSMAR